MFQGLLGLVIHLAEGMFGITDSFSYNFQRFGHSLLCFLVQVLPRVNEATGLALVKPTLRQTLRMPLQAIQL
jgi:hypothetical protein